MYLEARSKFKKHWTEADFASYYIYTDREFCVINKLFEMGVIYRYADFQADHHDVSQILGNNPILTPGFPTAAGSMAAGV